MITTLEVQLFYQTEPPAAILQVYGLLSISFIGVYWHHERTIHYFGTLATGKNKVWEAGAMVILTLASSFKRVLSLLPPESIKSILTKKIINERMITPLCLQYLHKMSNYAI